VGSPAGRMLVATLLCVASVTKLRDVPSAATMVGAALPRLRGTKVMVRLVAAAEGAVGIMLLAGWHPRIMLGASAGLLVIFSFVLVKAIRARYLGTCSCFGAGKADGPSWRT